MDSNKKNFSISCMHIYILKVCIQSCLQLGQLELLELVRVHILGVLGLRCRYDAVGENLACGALTLRHARSFPVRNCNCDGALYFYVPAVLSYIPWSYSARIASALWLVIV